jgi:hypothetical protein
MLLVDHANRFALYVGGRSVSNALPESTSQPAHTHRVVVSGRVYGSTSAGSSNRELCTEFRPPYDGAEERKEGGHGRAGASSVCTVVIATPDSIAWCPSPYRQRLVLCTL